MACKTNDNSMPVCLFVYALPIFSDYYISCCCVLEGLLFLKYTGDHSAGVKQVLSPCLAPEALPSSCSMTQEVLSPKHHIQRWQNPTSRAKCTQWQLTSPFASHTRSHPLCGLLVSSLSRALKAVIRSDAETPMFPSPTCLHNRALRLESCTPLMKRNYLRSQKACPRATFISNSNACITLDPNKMRKR